MRGADGHVTSAAELTSIHFTRGERMFPVVGVILSVQPSDDPANRTASNHVQSRGSRHECTVLASLDLGQPNILLENVIIPPLAHSGIDNLEEDLPRGVSSLVDGSQFNTDYGGLDLTTLDGEWCVVGFVGGSIGLPFIMSWWPHPINIFDLATSGNAYSKKALTQYDPKTNRGRKLWRNNGTMFLVNRDGSAYFDTTQAGRKVQISKDTNSPTSSQVAKGGHAQVDMKTTGQFEMNWNEKPAVGPQIGAGSVFQTTVCGETVGGTPKAVFEPDCPHVQPLPSTNPTVPPRQTTRTIIQGREYEVIVKTGKLILAAQAGSSAAGEVDLLVDALIKLKSGGNITMNAGANVEIEATAQANIVAHDLNATVAGKAEVSAADLTMSASGVATLEGQAQVAILAPGITLGGLDAADPLLLGSLWQTMMGQLMTALKALTVDIATGMVTPASQAALEAINSTIAAGAQLSKVAFTK